MIDLKRHVPTRRTRRLHQRQRSRDLPHVYGMRTRRPLPDLFVADRAEARHGSRFGWFFSTCLAAAVGAVAIAAVVFGSMDSREKSASLAVLSADIRNAASAPAPSGARSVPEGLNWASPKSDRLQVTMGAMVTKFIVQDSSRQRRGNREYLHNRPYARLTARLAAVPAALARGAPPFNPVRLYADVGAGGDAQGARGAGAGVNEGGEVTIRVLELHGSILPNEDGQEFDNSEIGEIIRRSTEVSEDNRIRPSFAPEGSEAAAASGAAPLVDGQREPLAPNTSVIEKSVVEQDDDAEDGEATLTRVRPQRGETLQRFLVRMGADIWMAQAMTESARTVLGETAITPNNEIELTLTPSPTVQGKLEPSRFTVNGEQGAHLVTVTRGGAGEFIASAEPVSDASVASRPAIATQDLGQPASLYAGVYHIARMIGMPDETTELMLRVHATDTDFRRRARANDGLELFFDLKQEDKGADSALGELLMTSITVGGASRRYYRFRSTDGIVDYYDQTGNNSRKFLIRRPVRDEDIRLTSGFGLRFHPLLNTRKLHTGEDWAGPIGTPVIATGNGVVEEAEFKGQYGNYVRIRHANGYQTTYGHLSRFANGIRPGARVRQGQLIAYIGNTGLSTGPHVHYEVLIGNRFVDPQSIKVPRERQLAGKQLNAFQRERSRIDELARRPPVRVQQLDNAQIARQ